MPSIVDPAYICPICLGIKGLENDQTLLKQADLVFRDDLVCVWINSFWIGENKGHVIVVPVAHHKTIYDLPKKTGHRIFEVAQLMSKALKESYHCHGITLRQNNDPAGDQHALHFHLHIFPRYENDRFNQNMAKPSRLSDPSERVVYVNRLQKYLKDKLSHKD